MGIQSELTEVGVFHYIAPFDNGLTENEVDHVFIGTLQKKIITPHPKEIQDYRWITVQNLKAELREKPTRFTPWLQQALNIVSFASSN